MAVAVFLDTSVLLAGLIDFGPQSAPAQSLMHAIAEGRVTGAATAWQHAAFPRARAFVVELRPGELGIVERRAGSAPAALDHFRRNTGAQDNSTNDWISRSWITASPNSNRASRAFPSRL